MTEQKIIREHIEELQRRIETVKRFMRTHEGADTSSYKDNIQRWETIIAALRKRIHKRAEEDTEESARYCKVYICPSCGEKFTGGSLSNNCYHCGQAFDWTGE